MDHIIGGTSYQYALRLCGLGEVLLVQGQFAESRDIFEESINGMKIGEKWGLGKALAGLSIATYKMGDKEKNKEVDEDFASVLDSHPYQEMFNIVDPDETPSTDDSCCG